MGDTLSRFKQDSLNQEGQKESNMTHRSTLISSLFDHKIGLCDSISAQSNLGPPRSNQNRILRGLRHKIESKIRFDSIFLGPISIRFDSMGKIESGSPTTKFTETIGLSSAKPRND